MEQALKQAQEDGVVIGLDATGPPVERLDIDQLLHKEPAAFNIYILALEKLQGQSDKMGWYQIAGIHGLPQSPWDGVEGPHIQWKAEGGYCTHGMLTFPTWHRPYVAMMEQSIFKTMLDIVVDHFPNSSKYRDAILGFRLPYWDPFRPRGGSVTFPGRVTPEGTTSFPYDFKLPDVLTMEELMVLKSESDTTLKRIPNPLYMFKFTSTGGTLPSEEWSLEALQRFSDKHTTRYPDQDTFQNSDSTELNSSLNRAREGLVKNMVNVLTADVYKDYRVFSNHGVQKTDTERGSIEGFHDQYHGIIGGGGHMGFVPIAAFDPVFWLHHCNIDRMFAIWQAINPSLWWPASLKDEDPKSTTPLTPFRDPNDHSKYWTSDSSQYCDSFGYTYSELHLGSSDAIAQDIGRRYNWSRIGDRIPPKDMRPLEVKDSPVFQYNDPSVPASLSPAITFHGSVAHHLQATAAHTSQVVTDSAKAGVQTVTSNNPHPAKEGSTAPDKASDDQKVIAPDDESASKIPEGAHVMRAWYVDAEAMRNALRGTFTVYYFIGDFEDNPLGYTSEPGLAGSAHFFIAPPQACDNCNRLGEAAAKVSNTTTITPILNDYVRNGQLESLEPEHVAPFLIENLKWRVIKAAAPENEGPIRPVPTDDIEGFKIHVNTDVSYIPQDSYLEVEVSYDDYTERIADRIDNGS